MQRSLTKLVNDLTQTKRAATLEETSTLVEALKTLDKQEKRKALVSKLKALRD